MRAKINIAISNLLNPLLMPSLTFLIMFEFFPVIIKPLSLMMLPLLFVTTFVIPLAGLCIFRYFGSISSFNIRNKDERIVPSLFISVCYAMTTYIFIFKIQVNQTVALILIATTLLAFVLTVTTFWIKISIHTASISGVAGFFFMLGIRTPSSAATYPLIGAVALVGLVMSARLQLNAHTPREVLVGLAIGLTICTNALYWFY